MMRRTEIILVTLWLIFLLLLGTIEYMHRFLQEQGEPPYDSVRAAFIEGKPIYPNAGFHEKTHIQICIINPNCIKGFFILRKENKKYNAI